MNEKLSLLHQASELLKKDNHTDLADELTELVEDLLTNLNNEETTAIEVSKQAIETFLETNKELLQKHEELTNITNRKSDLAALQGSIKEEESADEKSPSRSRRDRRGKTATKIAAGVTALFTVFKLRGKNTSSGYNSPSNSADSSTSHENLAVGPKRQQVLTEMQKIIDADAKNPIGYDFDDCSLENDRDINCSGLVYEIVQKRAGFPLTDGGVTSASLYQAMLNKGRQSQTLLQSNDGSVNSAGVQPGDTLFRCAKNKDFGRKNGSRPAKVNGMPVHHSALVQNIDSEGNFTVLESTGSTGVQIKTYTAQRWLENRKDELHVVKMPYEAMA